MVTLYRAEPMDGFVFEHFEGVFCRFYLPTEVVIKSPEVVYPYEARAYRTGLYIWKGKICDYKTILLNKVDDKDMCSREEIVLVEAFYDNGSDGHINFIQKGYVYMKGSDLDPPRYPDAMDRFVYDLIQREWADYKAKGK